MEKEIDKKEGKLDNEFINFMERREAISNEEFFIGQKVIKVTSMLGRLRAEIAQR